MIRPAIRLPRGFRLSALVALAVPAVLGLTALSTLADSSPSPSPGASGSRTGSTALPGDPTHGGTLYGQNCATCHGANLEGGIGAVLNPIDKLPGVPDTLDATFLISIITNGRTPQAGDPKQAAMPAKGGNSSLSDQDVKDLAAFIIQQNRAGGSPPLSPGELAKRTILWVSLGIIAMIFVTFLLSQYNMRWIARRAAARRK
ncbi:MAG TPA: cytochrome c [Candidatus Dormibacteraeota bacterium]|nr:cytochrome c [Candidatus Dormibacteraeota bacterium]